MTADVDSFSISLPPQWVRFPLEDGDFDAFVRGQRDRLRRSSGLSRTAERHFEVMMRAARNDCESNGIRMMATLLDLADAEDAEDTGDETGSEEPEVGASIEGAPEVEAEENETVSELIAASMSISVVTQAEIGSPVPLTVNSIQVAMSLDRLDEEPDKSADSMTNIEPPSVVTMPVGEVVKLIRLHRLKEHVTRGSSYLPRELPVFVQHYFVPIDEIGSSAAVVTFTTPMVALARPMSELFDAMMSTFEMHSGDDITDPGRAARNATKD